MEELPKKEELPKRISESGEDAPALPLEQAASGEFVDEPDTQNIVVEQPVVDSAVQPLSVQPLPVQPHPVVELPRVPIEAALGAGWEQLKSHALLLAAVSLLATVVMVAPLVVYVVIRELANRNLFLQACLLLLLMTVPFLYNIGRIKVSLRLVRGEAFDSDDFVNVAPWLFYYLVMLWCRATVTTLAYLFFVIPGVILHTRLDFAEFFIVDKHENPFKAMASSWRITENATMSLILFSATRFFVEFLGNLALLIGGIPARWMSLCAQAFVYERLSHPSGISEISIASSDAAASMSISISDSNAPPDLSPPVVEQPSSADSSV